MKTIALTMFLLLSTVCTNAKRENSGKLSMWLKEKIEAGSMKSEAGMRQAESEMLT